MFKAGLLFQHTCICGQLVQLKQLPLMKWQRMMLPLLSEPDVLAQMSENHAH